MNKAAIKQGKHQKLLVVGDFNASTSIAYKKCNYDGITFVPYEKCNGNGGRLKEFRRAKKIGIASTFFAYDNKERYTWISPYKKKKKVLDYVLAETYVQQ